MNERESAEPASFCGCIRPLRQSIDTCARCGRELGTTGFALSSQARQMARLIADHVLESLES